MSPLAPNPPLAERQAVLSSWRCDGRQSGWQLEHQARSLIELPVHGMDLRRIRGHQRLVDVTQAVVLGEGEAYEMASPTGQPRSFTCIEFDAAWMDQIGPPLPAGTHRQSPRTATLHLRLRCAPDEFSRDELTLALVHSLSLDSLETGASRRLQGEGLSPRARRLADHLGEYLAVHHAEALSLDQVAAACGASPFHASRVFRRVAGLSLHQQLTRLRLRAALNRLPAMRGRLTELALDLGFSSHSHFGNAFRAEYGDTPTAVLALLSSRA